VTHPTWPRPRTAICWGFTSPETGSTPFSMPCGAIAVEVRVVGYVPMEYCETAPPIHPARLGTVFGRLGLSHRHAEVLYLVAGIRELAVPPGVPPGETGRRPGPRLFLLRGPLRAGAGCGHDGPLGQRVSQDRRPPSRQRRAPVAAHLVLSRRAADRPQHEGPAKARGRRVRRNRAALAPLQRYAAIGAR